MIRRLIQWTVERAGERFEMDKRPLVIPAEQIRYAVIRHIREGNAVVRANWTNPVNSAWDIDPSRVSRRYGRSMSTRTVI